MLNLIIKIILAKRAELMKCNENVSGYVAFVLLCMALFLSSGCASFVTMSKGILIPDVEIRELVIEPADAMQQDIALASVIKRLNTTQYGIVLDDASHRGAKIFDYTALSVTLKEKVDRYVWKRLILNDIWLEDKIYSIDITNYCGTSDNRDNLSDLYTKSYSFASVDEAQRICRALVSLGVKSCQGEAAQNPSP